MLILTRELAYTPLSRICERVCPARDPCWLVSVELQARFKLLVLIDESPSPPLPLFFIYYPSTFLHVRQEEIFCNQIRSSN